MRSSKISRGFLANERVDENALEAAAFELGETVNQHVRPAFLISKQLNANAIRDGLLEFRAVDKIYSPAEPEHGLYIRILNALAPRLRAVAPVMPGYEIDRDAELLSKLAQVTNDTPRILAELGHILPVIEETTRKVDELVKRPLSERQRYTLQYLDALRTELNRVDIIGLSVDEPARGGELEIAYLSLSAHLGLRRETRRIDFSTLLNLLPALGNRIVVEGSAGSGKTTLLRWAAIQAAHYRLESTTEDPLGLTPDLDFWLPLFRTDDVRISRADLRDKCWRKRLPFFVPLRRTKHELDLNSIATLALRTIQEPPEEWTSDAVPLGLLLIDGVDEVPAGKERREAIRVIESWAKRFAEAQILVTTRPGAVSADALDGFRRVQLDELDPEQKAGFIEHWHRALGHQLRWPEQHPVLDQLSHGVRLEFERQHALNDLAVNPLLCASLCALHWDRRRVAAHEAYRSKRADLRFSSPVLPGTLWRICEALSEMLLERREQETIGLDREAFPAAYQLTYEQKRTILTRIAYSMAEKDMRSTLERAAAQKRVEDTLKDLGTSIDAPLGQSSTH